MVKARTRRKGSVSGMWDAVASSAFDDGDGDCHRPAIPGSNELENALSRQRRRGGPGLACHHCCRGRHADADVQPWVLSTRRAINSEHNATLSMPRLRQQLIARVRPLGVENREWPGRDDGFSSLHFQGKEFAHFHNDNELDIRLTRTLIRREGLVHPDDSETHPDRSPNSHWIEVRFNRPGDLDRVVRLVELAIKQL